MNLTPHSENEDSVSDAPIFCSLSMDDEDFRQIAKEFYDRLSNQLKEMKSQFEIGDYAELARTAHWLKGSGGTAGFDVFTPLAKQLEVAASSNDSAAAKAFINEIADLYGRIEVLPVVDA